jgi:hypothetical protein
MAHRPPRISRHYALGAAEINAPAQIVEQARGAWNLMTEL